MKNKTKKNIKKLKGGNKSDTSLIPKFKIINRPAFANVIFDLKKDQSIIVNSGMMNYIDSHINASSNTQGGVVKGLIRNLFTDASFFMTKYTGTKSTNEISCSSFLPGDILSLEIEPGENYLISHHSLVCFTENLVIETKSKLKGFFVNEGIFQTEIQNNSNKKGCVWLSAYGGYDLKTIKNDEAFKLDNGLFLAAKADVDYSISKLGSLGTAFKSGEGFLMEFKKPCKVYYAGRNLHSFERFIRDNSSKK